MIYKSDISSLRKDMEEKIGEYYRGHTDNYLYVSVKSDDDLENKIVDVMIKNTENEKLYGKLAWQIWLFWHKIKIEQKAMKDFN